MRSFLFCEHIKIAKLFQSYDESETSWSAMHQNRWIIIIKNWFNVSFYDLTCDILTMKRLSRTSLDEWKEDKAGLKIGKDKREMFDGGGCWTFGIHNLSSYPIGFWPEDEHWEGWKASSPSTLLLLFLSSSSSTFCYRFSASFRLHNPVKLRY